ncbi:sugar ABC transporter ATP-binding protein [Sediminivirga luteola]|jgi:ABC-type sugar transport system ATPase subunit|uniref:sugar ABC transporter ATP-binding protein n=1 Tax=Sediminivirga luteola TaxID=1774748 RepID=UPI001F572A9F|nr:sugar ABC transporter ATP-binding protein [Sediminivirga luteola]MCI2264324.1 sugar ABC transporter ATP-binding protein [Sediminivirga luteola]
MTPPQEPPRLEYESVTVDFGATRALSEISFSVRPGEIVGLLGHNGAGKSTLFNVTSGVIGATSGSFRVDGVNVGGDLSPRQAAELGITIIHQEPALAQNLTVLDNLFLARPAGAGADRKKKARAALEAVGADIPLDMPVDALGLGQRQLVDLARGMLAGEMKVLLLDEPTAALGKAETDALHALIRNFAERGVAVVYVSHRLPDIMEVCTRIVVLRGGELVVDDAAAGFTADRLARALVPELRDAEFIETVPGAEAFRIDTPGGPVTAREGEVVGLFGMAGGEQFALAASLAGVDGAAEYELRGARVRVASPRQAIKRGVFYVPPDRDTEGLIASETAKDNVMLPWFGATGGRGWWISDQTGAEVYRKARRALDIRGPAGDAEVSQFSGGNRQKHLLARWLYPARPGLLVLAQPTQGVDVGAKLDIVDAARTAARDGATVLVVSSESDEIASMCDRAYCLLGGRIREVGRAGDFNAALLAGLLSLAEPVPESA